jgi:YebC/PmpR family DNA-binding regulatory protein
MSGHSHAANIKHKKAAADAKKGKEFSRWAKAIMLAARTGGGVIETNLALGYAVAKAKACNMPRDTIERAIKKGTGELGGGELSEMTFEAVGPGGVAVVIECLTDNKNRTAPEIRKLLEQKNAKVSQVAWMFEKKGVIVLPKTAAGEDDVMGVALDAGADDMQTRDDGFEVLTSPGAFEAVKSAIEGKGWKPDVAEVMTVPKNRIEIQDPKVAKKVLDLLEAIDDHDDVQNVWSNQEIADEVAEQAKAIA